ncbi:MAG TPA: hypothetical protein VGI70_02520, partial [Polyangiales bacterium]
LSLAYHFIYFADFAALLASLFGLRALLARLPDISRSVADLMPVGFCVLLPIVFLCGGQLYDFLELFAEVAIPLLAISRRHLWLIAFVPLAACNKETVILTTLAIAPLTVSRWGIRRTWILALSAALASGVVIAIHLHYRTRPGEPFEEHLRENIGYWLRLDSYRQFTSILAPGVPFPKPQNLLLLAPLTAMLTWAYRHAAPRDERRWLTLAAALDLPLFVVLGYRDEIRALSLLFVPLATFCARFFSNEEPAR